jgi:hypothetical protein
MRDFLVLDAFAAYRPNQPLAIRSIPDAAHGRQAPLPSHAGLPARIFQP